MAIYHHLQGPGCPHPPITGLEYLLEYNTIVLFTKTQFLIWIRDSKPIRIWTRISRTKIGYASLWAALHWMNAHILCKNLSCFLVAETNFGVQSILWLKKPFNLLFLVCINPKNINAFFPCFWNQTNYILVFFSLII